MVVTEINTPISAPDFAVESESIPAAPAQTATKKASRSGLAMIPATSVWASELKVSGDDPGRPEDLRRQVGRGDRQREADRERDERAHRERPASLHERDAEPGDRPELRAHHHRADDQDRRVQQDPDRRDQRRQDHEREEHGREVHALRRPLLDLLPHHRVRRRTLRAPLGLVGELGDLRVHHLERDRPLLVDLELLEVGRGPRSRPRAPRRTGSRPLRAASPPLAGRSRCRPRACRGAGPARARRGAAARRCAGGPLRKRTRALTPGRPGPRAGRRASSIAGSRPTIRTPERNRRRGPGRASGPPGSVRPPP